MPCGARQEQISFCRYRSYRRFPVSGFFWLFQYAPGSMAYRVNTRRSLLRAPAVLLVLLLLVWTVDNLSDTREHIVQLGSFFQGTTEDGSNGDAKSKAEFVK
jgi:hypothetical protein